MQQIRNTWFNELGAIKLNCFNGQPATIQGRRMARNDKELAGRSNREIKGREIISLTGRQRKPSTFTLGELPAGKGADFTF